METQERSNPAAEGGLPTLAGAQLAMVYAPPQEFARLYEPPLALTRGTLFADLDKPLGREAR